jgi:hypothetical protein
MTECNVAHKCLIYKGHTLFLELCTLFCKSLFSNESEGAHTLPPTT